MRARCPVQPRTFGLITVLIPYGLYKRLRPLLYISSQLFLYFLSLNSKYFPEQPVVNYPHCLPCLRNNSRTVRRIVLHSLYFRSYVNIGLEVYEMEVYEMEV
jgi:hypothetical protein